MEKVIGSCAARFAAAAAAFGADAAVEFDRRVGHANAREVSSWDWLSAAVVAANAEATKKDLEDQVSALSLELRGEASWRGPPRARFSLSNTEISFGSGRTRVLMALGWTATGRPEFLVSVEWPPEAEKSAQTRITAADATGCAP